MRVRVAGMFAYGLGVIMMVVAIQQTLLAVVPLAAPEIDGASISAGLGVLAASILILRSRRRTK